MAKRWLEVEVQRTQQTTVFLEGDDEDPRFARLLDAQETNCLGLLGAVEPFIGKAVDETVRDYDWETPWLAEEPFFPVEACAVKEIPEKEARQYHGFTVPPLTGEERAEGAKEAGQLALEGVA